LKSHHLARTWPAILATVVLVAAHAALFGFALQTHLPVALVAGLVGLLVLKSSGGDFDADAWRIEDEMQILVGGARPIKPAAVETQQGGRRPECQSLRYEENWSALRDRSLRTSGIP
jgi:hypothetical protein